MEGFRNFSSIRMMMDDSIWMIIFHLLKSDQKHNIHLPVRIESKFQAIQPLPDLMMTVEGRKENVVRTKGGKCR